MTRIRAGLTGLCVIWSCGPAAVEAPFVASGNGPFWRLELTARELRLSRLGLPDLTLPVVARAGRADGRMRGAAGAPAQGLRLEVIRGPGPCRDTMTGMPFRDLLVVRATGEGGCGGDPRDLLLVAGGWRVTAIAGQALAQDAAVEMAFDAAGGVTGQGGCNGWFAPDDLRGEGLVIGPLGATRRACARSIMDREVRLFAALAGVTRFDVTDTGDLVLWAGDSAVLVARPASRATQA